MNDTATAPRDPSSLSSASKTGWFILIALTLYVCYFSHAGALGFTGPDEPRYAWIARSMAESGDWVTPRLYGRPWFEKPALYYWEAAASFKIFGVNEAAARLPSAVNALLATLAMGWLALRLYGGETARWLLLLLPSTVGMTGFSHAASTDMPFSGTLTVAMVAAAAAIGLRGGKNESPPGRGVALAVFGAFLGLAVLAKGPAAIILAGGGVLAWAAIAKRWRDALRFFHPLSAGPFLAVALPWYVLCARRNPDFFHVFIVEHNFERFLTPEFQHIQPFWYYVPIVVLALLPWAPILIATLNDGITAYRGRTWRESPQLFLVCWALFTIVFFSVSKSKLPGYILPAIPPAMLIVARTLTRRMRQGVNQTAWMAAACAAALLLFAAPFLALMQFSVLGNQTPVPEMPAVFFVGAGAAIVLSLMRRISLSFQVQTATLIAAVYLLLVPFVKGQPSHSFLDPLVSAREYARPPKGVAPADWYGRVTVYKLKRAQVYALNFYLHEELPEWSVDRNAAGWVLTDVKNAGELNAMGLDCKPPEGPGQLVSVCQIPGSASGSHDGGQAQ